MSECLDLLKQLVSIPSVNPAYGGPGEAEVEAFVTARLRDAGIEFRTQEVLPGRNNVVARIGPADVPAVLLDGHMDTVGVDGWAVGESPYTPVERDGKLYARGSCDTKASLSVFLTLAERLSSRSGAMKRALVFAATADEESAQLGAYKLAELFEELNVNAAITGEPTGSALITKHKGACRYRIEATGKAAHGSTPELGENAIYKIARITEKLSRYAELLSKEESLGYIEKGSLNVGRIGGGIGFNIVPDQCGIEVDRRLGVLENMEESRVAIDSIVEGEEGVSVSTFLERPALNTDNESWFPQAMRDAASMAGEETAFGEVAFMTNGVAYAEAGVPTVVFGPGSIEQAHKTDEYIELGEMERSLAILEKLFI